MGVGLCYQSDECETLLSTWCINCQLRKAKCKKDYLKSSTRPKRNKNLDRSRGQTKAGVNISSCIRFNG